LGWDAQNKLSKNSGALEVMTTLQLILNDIFRPCSQYKVGTDITYMKTSEAVGNVFGGGDYMIIIIVTCTMY